MDDEVAEVPDYAEAESAYRDGFGRVWIVSYAPDLAQDGIDKHHAERGDHEGII